MLTVGFNWIETAGLSREHLPHWNNAAVYSRLERVFCCAKPTTDLHDIETPTVWTVWRHAAHYERTL